MELEERTNGRTQTPFTVDATPVREPQRYMLTPQEKAMFEQYTIAVAKIKASMWSEAESLRNLEASLQTMLQLLVTQQGLQSPKGFVLTNDCSAVVEQM